LKHTGGQVENPVRNSNAAISNNDESQADAQRKPSELRGKLLTGQTVQIVLSGLIEGSVDRIEPIFNSDRMPRYVIVENVARVDPSEARSLTQACS